MTLYEIDTQLKQAIEQMIASVDPETGEVDDELAAAIDNLETEKTSKIEGIGCYIKNIDAEATAISEEIAVLKSRLEAKKAHSERLRDYVKGFLLADDQSKFETSRVCFTFRKSEAVEIDEGAELPEKYMKIVTTSKPDKTAIKAAIKSGEEVPGARIVINQNLQMK